MSFKWIFPIAILFSLLFHSAVLWVVFKGRPKKPFQGKVYRPSTTVYVRLNVPSRFRTVRTRKTRKVRRRRAKVKTRVKTKTYVKKASGKRYKSRKVPKESKETPLPPVRSTGTVGGPMDIAVKEYYNSIWSLIKSNWVIPEYLKGRGLVVVIGLRIRRDGKVENLQVEKSSGNRVFDDYAIKAIKASEPFPPLPKEIKGEYLDLGVIFRE